MTRRRLGIIAIIIAFVLLVCVAGVWLVRNSDPVARPCVPAATADIMSVQRAHAQTVRNIETIADEVDVICVLEATDDPNKLVMHYYEDDDGLADFATYALVTRHVRHLLRYREFTGTPDPAQLYALVSMLGVRADGTMRPVYKFNGTRWTKANESIAHPGALATHVRYGNNSSITVKQAFNNLPPTKYRKGIEGLSVGTATVNFDQARKDALKPIGRNDDTRRGTTVQPTPGPQKTSGANPNPNPGGAPTKKETPKGVKTTKRN